MSELNTFETRFAVAYRRYLDKAPRQLDAATVVRTVTAQPRGRAIAWPWTVRPLVFRPAQALAWLVVLGLLLALMAAAVFVGSQRPAPALAFCPAGSTPDRPGPADQARPAHDSPQTLAFDRRAGRIVTLVNVNDAAETWTFDVCTNTWQQMHPDQEPPPDSWGRQSAVYDVSSDVTIFVGRDQPTDVWVYDLQANTWTYKGVAPSEVAPIAHDPLTGLVLAANNWDNNEVWSYEVETGTWAPIRETGRPQHVRGLAYDASADRLIGYGPETWLFDIRTGDWTMSSAYTPPVDYGMSSISMVYDEAAQRTVVLGFGAAAYDSAADQWEGLDETGSYPYVMVYDSVNRRLVGMDRPDPGPWPGPGPVGRVVALDLMTGQWTVLLEGQ